MRGASELVSYVCRFVEKAAAVLHFVRDLHQLLDQRVVFGRRLAESRGPASLDDGDGTSGTIREGVAGVETARRAIFVVDEELTVIKRWIAEDWISPSPVDEIEAAVAEL